jgi:hypothetical protein
MSVLIFILVSFATAVAMSAWQAHRASPRGQAIRAARRLAVTDIRQVGEGSPVLIVGRVRLAKSSLRTPFLNTPCCFYEATCGYDETNPDPSATYGGSRDGVTEHQVCDFFLKDGTGKALVRVRDEGVVHYTRNRAAPATDAEHMHAFLARHGRSVGDHSWSASEWTLEEGMLVAVSGIGHWEPDPDPGSSSGGGSPYREPPRRLVVSAPDPLPLLVSDHPALLSKRSNAGPASLQANVPDASERAHEVTRRCAARDCPGVIGRDGQCRVCARRASLGA